jgi:hypothetical protein
MMTARYPAGHATYPGDARTIVGEFKGPTTLGTVVIAERADYDAEQDSTRVAFVYADEDDLQALMAVPDGE